MEKIKNKERIGMQYIPFVKENKLETLFVFPFETPRFPFERNARDYSHVAFSQILGEPNYDKQIV